VRRISIKNALPGMISSKAVYDSYGALLLDSKTKLLQDSVDMLTRKGIRELIIEDSRFGDIPVQTLIAPGLEAQAVQSLVKLLTESQGGTTIGSSLLTQLEQPVYAMVRELFPIGIGEINATGFTTPQEFVYVRPVKVAGLSMLVGAIAGYGMAELASLGLAATLMDCGYVALPKGLSEKSGSCTDQESREIFKHPQYGAAILNQTGRYNDQVIEGILHHHERWDGSGYPSGLKGAQICLPARILAIADTFYELVSDRPGRKAYLPHEAVEYIMAYSGDLFDHSLVQIFAREVPLYPTGVAVKLNSGELGIISDGNRGHIGRPMVRICFDKDQRMLMEPYDINLSEAEYQNRLIVHIFDY